jgi:hypothetical protein
MAGRQVGLKCALDNFLVPSSKCLQQHLRVVKGPNVRNSDDCFFMCSCQQKHDDESDESGESGR